MMNVQYVIIHVTEEVIVIVVEIIHVIIEEEMIVAEIEIDPDQETDIESNLFTVIVIIR